MKLLALADDVTGALEVGALLQAPVLLDLETEPVDRSVIDTETRHVNAQESADRILNCIRNRQPELIYKKTDSTLRGNIGAELAALANAYPERQLIFLPAYPAMGRTVVKGELLVHGVPVHLSDFASDPLNPVTKSTLATLFHPDVRVSIVDASTDDDIARAIAVTLQIRPLPILAGPASVARGIARHFGLDSSPQEQIRLSPRCLIVNGSLHPVAKEQVRRIRQGAGWVVMNFESKSETAQAFAVELAQAVRERLEQEFFETLIVLGGDTTFALLTNLNARVIHPIGEVAAGVPVSRVGPWQLVTKAGGFGDVDLLARLQRAAT
ncbi:MAG: four-carbon acid sugar kinase family protein [Bryobacteraceae bacterium]